MGRPNLKKYFSKLEFDELKHQYSVNGFTLPSVSTLLTSIKPHFDTHVHAEIAALAEDVDKEVILGRWKLMAQRACDRGTDIHNFAEFYVAQRYGLQTDALPSDNYYLEYEAVKEFWKHMPAHYEVINLELRMYNLMYHYAGTADIILRNKNTGKYIIGDYKTNFSITSGFPGDFLEYPFQMYENRPVNIYAIQLNYYQVLLEAHGLEVERRMIIHLKGDEYVVHDAEDLTQIIIQDFNEFMDDEDQDEF